MQTGIFLYITKRLTKNSNVLRTIYIMIKFKIQNVSKYDTE